MYFGGSCHDARTCAYAQIIELLYHITLHYLGVYTYASEYCNSVLQAVCLKRTEKNDNWFLL